MITLLIVLIALTLLVAWDSNPCNGER